MFHTTWEKPNAVPLGKIKIIQKLDFRHFQIRFQVTKYSWEQLKFWDKQCTFYQMQTKLMTVFDGQHL